MTDSTVTRTMTQSALYPEALEKIVNRLRYRNGWTFSLRTQDRGQQSRGLTFVVTVACEDAYNPERMRTVLHYFIVPAANYDYQNWRRWVLDRVHDVETHEMCEFFAIDGERPYAPNHGDGRDPYVIFEKANAVEAERRPGA